MPDEPLVLDGLIADETGSGNNFALDLSTPVEPGNALLLLVCYEPFYLNETYTTASPPAGTRNKHIVLETYLSDGETDPYENRNAGLIGFGHWRVMNYARIYDSNSAVVPGVAGLPANHVKVAPSGFRAEGSLIAPEPGGADIDQLVLHWDKLTPRAATNVTWFSAKAWHLSNYDPDGPSLSGVNGVFAVEPEHHEEQPSTELIMQYCPGPGDDAFDFSGTFTSDGGDVGRQTSSIGGHVLDTALVARWGAGDGAWTFEDDYPWTLLDTVTRDQGGGIEAYVEFHYRILTPAGASSYSTNGTFGTQTAGGIGGDDHYQWVGGLLRAVDINSFIEGGGGWLPQIYRRMVETEVG